MRSKIVTPETIDVVNGVYRNDHLDSVLYKNSSADLLVLDLIPV